VNSVLYFLFKVTVVLWTSDCMVAVYCVLCRSARAQTLETSAHTAPHMHTRRDRRDSMFEKRRGGGGEREGEREREREREREHL
jgi:hypothetical protein